MNTSELEACLLIFSLALCLPEATSLAKIGKAIADRTQAGFFMLFEAPCTSLTGRWLVQVITSPAPGRKTRSGMVDSPVRSVSTGAATDPSASGPELQCGAALKLLSCKQQPPGFPACKLCIAGLCAPYCWSVSILASVPVSGSLQRHAAAAHGLHTLCSPLRQHALVQASGHLLLWLCLLLSLQAACSCSLLQQPALAQAAPGRSGHALPEGANPSAGHQARSGRSSGHQSPKGRPKPIGHLLRSPPQELLSQGAGPDGAAHTASGPVHAPAATLRLSAEPLSSPPPGVLAQPQATAGLGGAAQQEQAAAACTRCAAAATQPALQAQAPGALPDQAASPSAQLPEPCPKAIRQDQAASSRGGEDTPAAALQLTEERPQTSSQHAAQAAPNAPPQVAPAAPQEQQLPASSSAPAASEPASPVGSHAGCSSADGSGGSDTSAPVDIQCCSSPEPSPADPSPPLPCPSEPQQQAGSGRAHSPAANRPAGPCQVAPKGAGSPAGPGTDSQRSSEEAWQTPVGTPLEPSPTPALGRQAPPAALLPGVGAAAHAEQGGTQAATHAGGQGAPAAFPVYTRQPVVSHLASARMLCDKTSCLSCHTLLCSTDCSCLPVLAAYMSCLQLASHQPNLTD